MMDQGRRILTDEDISAYKLNINTIWKLIIGKEEKKIKKTFF